MYMRLTAIQERSLKGLWEKLAAAARGGWARKGQAAIRGQNGQK